jgi:hypothetical protein
MADGNSSGQEAQTFVSKLSDGRQRFLSHVIEHALSSGRRSADDFIRHFPPDVIMEGLKDQPHLRGRIIVMATGLKEKIAVKKSVASTAEDLQIALDVGETNAAAVMECFEPDDRVRYLEPRRLWSFLIEGDFWTIAASKKDDFERAKEHITFMLERALTDKLLNHRDIVEGVTVHEIVMRLPKSELHKIIEGALENSHRNTPFTESNLLGTIPAATLLKYVPLPHVWSTVIEPKVARAHSYVAADDAPASGDDLDEDSIESERQPSAAAAES